MTSGHAQEDLPHVILDGKVIEADRCRDGQREGEVTGLWYSGKAHSHGGNIQAVFAPGDTAIHAGPSAFLTARQDKFIT